MLPQVTKAILQLQGDPLAIETLINDHQKLGSLEFIVYVEDMPSYGGITQESWDFFIRALTC